MTVTIKTPEEIKKLRQGGKILAKILKKLGAAAKPGVSTMDLEELSKKLMAEYKVKPSFFGFGEPAFPATICASNNEGIVHCIPNETKLKDGDILGIDCGIWHEGLCTDAAITVGIGKISAEAKQLMEVTKKSLTLAIKQIKPGNTVGDIGYAVQSYVDKFGYGIVRGLVGHGVGYEVHEEPRIPNFGKPNTGEVLKEGMVIAVEPMITLGDYAFDVLENGWDIVTKDRSLAAHFEHTIAVTKRGCEVLTK
ncbi:MAG: type I methionyl aminopeptidase [Candidatus Komeilibacteria bacterium]|nr:type I methionyl aminopeptidase [Candidatus Komeilibacteria bacterium]